MYSTTLSRSRQLGLPLMSTWSVLRPRCHRIATAIEDGQTTPNNPEEG